MGQDDDPASLRAENEELKRRLGRLLAERAASEGGGPRDATPATLLLDLEDRSPDGLETFPFAAWRCDARGAFVHVNPAWTGFTGMSAASVLARGRRDAIHPEDRERCDALFAQALSVRRAFECAYRLRRHDGQHRWVVEWAIPETGPDGAFTGFVGVTQDISERRLADEAQRALERRILCQQDALVRIATHPAVVSGDLGAALRAITRTIADVMEVERVGVWLFDASGTRLECHHVHARSTSRPASGPPLRIGEFPIYAAAIEADRTLDADDVRTDPRTQELLEVYLEPHGIRSMLDAAVRLDGRVVGVVCHEHVGEPRAWHADEVAFAGEAADQVAQALLGAQRREARKELERTLELLDKAQQIAHIGCWEWDPRSGLVRWSDESYRIHGRPPRDGELLTFDAAVAQIHPDDRDRVIELSRAVAEGRAPPALVEYRIVRGDGHERIVVGDGAIDRGPDGTVQRLLGTIQDVTDRKRQERERLVFEARVQQAQKLESLGILAGGVAHDFNNLLVSVLGNAGLLLQDLPADSPLRARLEHIERSAQEAAQLANQMLAYSGRGQFAVERIDLAELVRQSRPLLEAATPRRVAITLECSEAPVLVEGDAAQLRQVVVNLVANAADALGTRPGRIVVRVREREADRALLSRAVVDAGREPGRYAALEVTDDGDGMDAGVQARIFDPFFTTKETGRGLGLPAVLGIVRGHRGALVLDSHPGDGTTVTILLPPAREGAGRAPRDEGAPAAARAEGGSAGLVLVADDEESVRFVACAMLERAGYEVLTASDGLEALERFEEAADRIDLVLLDVTMPRLGGAEVLAALRARRPDVRVVLTSGYGQLDAAPLDVRPDAFLHKPYRMPQLVAAIEEALGS